MAAVITLEMGAKKSELLHVLKKAFRRTGAAGVSKPSRHCYRCCSCYCSAWLMLFSAPVLLIKLQLGLGKNGTLPAQAH